MSYTVRRTNGNTLVEVPDQTINTTECSLALLGRGAVNYGQGVAENFVKLLENFAHSTAPARPLVGQFWYDTTNKTPKVYNGQSWVGISGGGTIEIDNSTKTGGFTGIQVTIGVDNHTVGVGMSNGQIVHVTSALDFAVGQLPTSVTINGRSYAFAPRFPQGVQAGITMATDTQGYVFAGTATSAQYADLAERYETSEPVEAGDVVEIGGVKEIRKTTRANTTDIFGVISTKPGFMLNENAGSDETHPYVALAGRVPVKVVGTVMKGQRLVASDVPGVAQAASDNAPFQAILGRALQDKFDGSIGLVEIVLGGVK